MTNQEKKELDMAIFYGHFQMIESALEDCDNVEVAFYIGRAVGMMQETLRRWPADEGEAVK